MNHRVYKFAADEAEGDRSLNRLLGGKGANLAEMTRLGINVPPGFTITTEVCSEFYQIGGKLPENLWPEIEEGIAFIERKVGRAFGDANDPLLVSVRSGAPVSMPGMMDTILNLGLTSTTVEALSRVSGDPHFAWDTYRRLIQMFGGVVLGISSEEFEKTLEKMRQEQGVKIDHELDAAALQKVASEYLNTIRLVAKTEFPQDPQGQLRAAVEAVFRSWKSPRAITYRRLHNISETLGTAVTVQAMVFGNRGAKSATGVLFTRNPSTGEKGLVGEYLCNAQGEDVVAGIRTPAPLNHRSVVAKSEGIPLETEMPEIYRELEAATLGLEKHYRDVQDIEFTVEDGRLWILQTRSGKRTAKAALRIAVEMVGEGLLDRGAALMRLQPKDLDQLLHPIFDPKASKEVIATGLGASPGAVSGKVVFSADEAERWAARMEKVILVRSETAPEDIHGMHASQGILTSRGGMTSHAAVVGRGMGKCCVVGCSEINVHSEEKVFVTANGERFTEGAIISLDGSTGEVLRGEVSTTEPSLDRDFTEFMSWADKIRSLKIRANADTPTDCRIAREFGAQGVGLCRTEHMFFDKKRIDIVRQMILAESPAERVRFLDKIFPMQLDDFRAIFREMTGLPVTIRLLDPPLHEFLPQTDPEIRALAKRTELGVEELKKNIARLHEFNPMLGHRGCRLGVTFPEIYEMQVRAIVAAACEVSRESAVPLVPEIMVPLVADPREFEWLKERIVAVAEGVKKEKRSDLEYLVGTMIELPRAALLAGEIARTADFFSFGTNDLTQTAFGLSRDDSSRFLPTYYEKGLLPRDPFASLDIVGVGELIRLATKRGRQTKESIKVGVCGEHGGDHDSIVYFHSLGFDYVSCSPYRVPLARLAAAQATLNRPVAMEN